MTVNINQAEFKHFLGKARDAARFGVDACPTWYALALRLAMNPSSWSGTDAFTATEPNAVAVRWAYQGRQ